MCIRDRVLINSVSPNPWVTNTEIEFTMPQESLGRWEFYDVNGRLVYELSALYKKGLHSLSLDKSEINGTGIIYVKLTTDHGVAEHKMLMIK